MSFQISDLQAYASRFYGGAPILLTPFAYTATFGSIADTVTDQVIINVASNADFIFTELAYNVILNEPGVADTQVLLVKLQIEDTGSNEKFFNDPVMLDNCCNNAWGPQAFAFPRFVSGKTALKVNATNVSGLFNVGQTYSDGFDVVLTGVLVRVFQTA
jgi:hypothetical protein